MDASHPTRNDIAIKYSAGERRMMDRADDILRMNYQAIHPMDALKDPYDASFALPRYFQMLNDLERLGKTQQQLIDKLCLRHPELGDVLDIFDQKIALLTTSLYDMMASTMPAPVQVNVSPSGLSFNVTDELPINTHLHVTLTHPDHQFHVAATARVVYCTPRPNGFRIGAHFISIRPADRNQVAERVKQQKTTGS